MNDLFAVDDAGDQVLTPEPPRERRGHRRDRAIRRQRRRRRTTVVMTVVFVLIVTVVALAFPVIRDTVSGWRAAGPEDYPGPGSGSAEVVIPKGATGADMGEVLAEADVVASVPAFTQAFSANVNAARIQPGTYSLLKQMAADDAVAALLDPANKAEVTITVPEGFQAKQVYERIASVAGIPLEEVQAAAQDAAAIGLPAESGGNPEGWLAAATYSFQPGDDATTMLHTMVGLTLTRLDEAGVPVDQRQAVLIKASIIEREVNLPEYYGPVARVIENRLVDQREVNGLLQMDSTVQYGLGRVGGSPTSAELQDASNPYNTYVHPGLPPTPIGAPGAGALAATADPPPGTWLYFVTVNLDTGETKFASTLSEHQAYVAELRAWQAANPG